jgi:O-antigen/teichoic acid export membrane protein
MAINREKSPVIASAQARFIRDSFLFSILLVLGGLLRMLRAFILARWLGPQAFGTWTFVHIFSNYIPLSDLGMQKALLRQLPFLRGRNDVEGTKAVLNTASTINFFGAIIYSVVVLVWSFFLQQSFNSQALSLYAPAILLTAWAGYGKAVFLSTGLYEFRRRLEMLDVVLSSLFPIILGYWWGVRGAIIGLGISALIVVIMAARQLWQRFVFQIDWRIFRALFLTGLPILANALLRTTMHSVDRLLIAALLNHELLGVYSIANAGMGILGTIPSSLGRMLFVKFAEMDGESKTKANMFRAFHQSTAVLSSLFAPLVALSIVLFPIIVAVLLPKFVQGIAAGKLLIASIFFIGVSLPATNLCISTGRFKFVLVLKLVVVAAEFISVYLVIRNSMRLDHIALCVLCACAFFCVTMIIFCNRLYAQTLKHRIRCMANAMLPFLSVLVSLYTQNYIPLPKTYNQVSEILVYGAINFVIILVVSLPFVYLVNRRTQVFQKLMLNI